MSKIQPIANGGCLSAFIMMRAAAFALAGLLSAFGTPAFSQDDQNNDLGQALANALVNSLAQAARDGAERNWHKLDPAVLNCLGTQYSIDPDQLASQGIGPGASQFKPYVKECQRLTAPPPLQIDGFVESASGTYVRTGLALAKIESRFAIRTTASEAGADTREARLSALIVKVKKGCARFSISAIHFFDAGDENSKANKLNENWADAEVECGSDLGGDDSADALTIDDLTNGDRNALFFGVHSAELNAPFAGAFNAVVAELHARTYHVLKTDKDKGIILTGNPGRHEFKYDASFYIVLAPETDATTHIALKLVEGSLEPVKNAATLFHPQDRETTDQRVEQIISEIKQRLGGGHV